MIPVKPIFELYVDTLKFLEGKDYRNNTVTSSFRKKVMPKSERKANRRLAASKQVGSCI